MRRITKIASLMVLSSFLLFSCGEGQVIHKDVLDSADIVLTAKEKTMTVGEKYQIQATYVIEEKEESVTLSYRSLDNSVATVSSTGLVEAVGVGEAIIQITYNTTKTLFKVIVKGNEELPLLGLNIVNESLSLYEGDQFEFKYETRLNGEVINLNATYYDFDTSIISISDDTITALSAGTTNAKIKVTYGELIAEKSFTVTVKTATYNLWCNYESDQVVAGEEPLKVTYSLSFGSTLVKTLSLSEMSCNVSDNTIATVSSDYITGLKKGNFTLSVSYYVSDIQENVTSVESFRCRERYTVNFIDLTESISLLDGELINYVPTNSDKKLVFDAWLKDGVEFNEPVESNLDLVTRWKVNEFDFAQDIRGAKSYAPTEEETIEATSYNDYGVFANGLKYGLSKNSHDETQNDNTIAHIYLPKMDYRQCNKVVYQWKTGGWVAIDSYPDNWYNGPLSLGGTIEISYDGRSLTQTITETDVNYANNKLTIVCNDTDVIQGNKNLESLGYWAFTSITAPNYIYLSNPKITVVRCTTHHFVNTPTADKIGYYDLVCSICGENAGQSDETMMLSDINFVNNQYGAYGGRWADIFPVSDSDAFKTEKSLKYEVSAANTEDQIFLPRINFKAYKVVQFAVNCSSWAIGAGLSSGSYILPFGTEQNRSTGILSFVFDGEKVTATLTCNETSLSQQIIITDSNIISGQSSASLYMSSTAQWQTVTINLNVLSGTCTHNYVNVVPSDKIGYFDTVCSLCGENGGPSEEVMTINDVNFIQKQFGAHGGKWGDIFPVTDSDAFKTEKTLKYEVSEANAEEQIYLPRINYKAYTTVQFSVTCGSFAIAAGLESGSYVLPNSSNSADPAHTGVLTIRLNGNALNVSLKCNETSDVQNITITDEDIINGKSSISLFIISSYLWQTVTVGLNILSGSCSHSYTDVVPVDKIGYYNTVCSLCGEPGEPSDKTMSFADVDFTKSTFGAYGGKWGTNVQPTAKTMTYEITEGHAENEIHLPKINFSAYSSVSFSLAGNVWDARVGLESASYAFPYSASGVHTGTLTFTYDGEKVTVYLECSDGTNQNLVVTDADIINGDKAFSLFMTADDPYRTISIELLTLN